MVTRHGMAPTVGPVAYEGEGAPFLGGDGHLALLPRAVSEATQRDIEEAVRTLVERGLARATRLLTHHRAALDEGVRRLLAAETLTAEQLPTVTPLPVEAPVADAPAPEAPQVVIPPAAMAAAASATEDGAGAPAPRSVGERRRA
jgi:cell division protease FtsH